jgi:hypothetical protein
MVINLNTVKNLRCFCDVLLMVSGFPIRVYTKSALPSLLPDPVIGPIIVPTLY